MIISRIHSGLGNQLFQYAAGRALALRSKQEFKIHPTGFDMDNLITLQKNSDIYVYRLNLFNITAPIASAEEVRRLHEPYGWLSKKWNIFKQKYIGHSYVNFFPHIYRIKGPAYLDGYWQTERYFDDYPDVLRQEFQLKDPLAGTAKSLSQKIKSAPQSCFIHIRRGDYVTLKLAQDLKYYVDGIRYIKERYPHVSFFVFSNDIPWAKEHIDVQGSPLTFVSDPTCLTPQEELILMSHCNHAIISNSSFSWWGAWLIDSPKKTVIAPLQWGAKDVVPSGWIRL
jgi:hypothetical protein